MQFHHYSNGPETSAFLFMWCYWAVLSRTWALGMVSERDRSHVCWCISGQTFWEPILWEQNSKCQSHWHQTIGSFNYIYSNFIPHWSSTQPSAGTAESMMKPDVVFNLCTSFGKQTHLTVETFWKQVAAIPSPSPAPTLSSSTPPRIIKCQNFISRFAWIVFGQKWYLAIVLSSKLYL